MSHEIRKYDEQHGRAQAWHGLTKVNPALAMDNPDFYLGQWDVEAVACTFKKLKGGQFVSNRSQEYHALVVNETRPENPLHVSQKALPDFETLFVSTPYCANKDKGAEDKNPSYVPLSNAEFLSLIRESLKASGLSLDVESCGSVFDRRRVFVSIALPGKEASEMGGREFKNFLNFINSFDMTTPFMANTSNICTVCNNTLTMNLAAGGCMVKHTKNMPSTLAKLPNVIQEALTRQAEFANDFLSLHSEGLTLGDARAIFTAFVSTGNILSTRALNIGETLTQLFVKGKGNSGETFADAFSAFTDYYTHLSAGGGNKGSELKQLESSEFGDGARTKREAMAYLLSLASNGEMKETAIQNGLKLIADYNKKA